MRILIADDDPVFRKVLRQLLEPDYEVLMANDGEQAWDVLQSVNAPRLAILDWVMPRLTGPQICRRVRACPLLSSTYLILLTAKNSQAEIVAGLRAGADDYIPKPPKLPELKSRVRMAERVLALQDSAQAQSEALDAHRLRRTQVNDKIQQCPLRNAAPMKGTTTRPFPPAEPFDKPMCCQLACTRHQAAEPLANASEEGL
jgi:DNA-binding response OmpR family regulator